jgi:stage IV sporulation protein A
MEDYSIYNDITRRTDGSIYVGVVGPVRTGKSTFIKKFMETLVIPNIENEFSRERARDELPQSASGKTIMTTEPKFIPNEAVEVRLENNARFKVRMIDCVGYIVSGALGYIEENAPRMVTTPWFDEPISFNKAAEIGTKKVITEHSTIGLVVTTDGSILDIPRYEYEEAESRVIKELKGINKPFVILLNCADPKAPSAMALQDSLRERYDGPGIAVTCRELDETDIKKIMETVLFEFPVREVSLNMPGWIYPLSEEHWLKSSIYSAVLDNMRDVKKVRGLNNAVAGIMSNSEYIENCQIENASLGDGTAQVKIEVPGGLYYKILGEVSGLEIKDEESLIRTMKDLARVKKEYDKVAGALEEVRLRGRYGIRLKASAPSIHMLRANIETVVSPIVGSEKQSEELVNYLMREFEVDPKKIWESNFFGKALHELVNEGLHNKLYRMPDDARFKLQETLEKIINEGSGGLICIIL